MAKGQQASKDASEERAAESVQAQAGKENSDGAVVAKQVKVRVLRDCQFGACNAVAVIDKALAETLEGVVDMSPEAVAYAESLI